MLIFPAHGALGGWDEIIFLAVVVVFVVMMAVSWLRGQSTQESVDPDQADAPEKADENRFELK
jgi:hypothetical protein